MPLQNISSQSVLLTRSVTKLAIAIGLCICCACLPLCAQQPSTPPGGSASSPQATAVAVDGSIPHPNETRFLQHLAEDQKDIWTSPFHLKPSDAKWLVSMSGIATGLFVTDPQSSYAMRLDHLHALRVASDAGLASAAGMTGAAYIWGHLAHNERARETGVLRPRR